MARRTRRKAPDALRTIGEAATELGLQPHVLRFWETRFTVLKPLKRADGRRSFRPEDMQALRAIRMLVHDQGMTLKGAADLLRARGVEAVLSQGGVSVAPELKPAAPSDLIDRLKKVRERMEAAL